MSIHLNRTYTKEPAYPEHLTTGQASMLCKISTQTVINWIRQGRFSCYRVENGPRKIPTIEVQRFMEAHKIPMPDWMRKLAA